MNKTELEKAIENGESVWVVSLGNVWEIKPTIKDLQILPTFKDIYKTQAEAEHYLHHANVTRIEELPFLTWEEFLKEKRVEFIGEFGKRYSLRIYGNKILLEEHESDGWVLMDDLTETNFYKAYDECVSLFGSEE